VSVAYYLVLDREDPGFDPSVDGKAVGRFHLALDI
jgi:hypothetical protein